MITLTHETDTLKEMLEWLQSAVRGTNWETYVDRLNDDLPDIAIDELAYYIKENDVITDAYLKKLTYDLSWYDTLSLLRSAEINFGMSNATIDDIVGVRFPNANLLSTTPSKTVMASGEKNEQKPTRYRVKWQFESLSDIILNFALFGGAIVPISRHCENYLMGKLSLHDDVELTYGELALQLNHYDIIPLMENYVWGDFGDAWNADHSLTIQEFIKDEYNWKLLYLTDEEMIVNVDNVDDVLKANDGADVMCNECATTDLKESQTLHEGIDDNLSHKDWLKSLLPLLQRINLFMFTFIIAKLVEVSFPLNDMTMQSNMHAFFDIVTLFVPLYISVKIDRMLLGESGMYLIEYEKDLKDKIIDVVVSSANILLWILIGMNVITIVVHLFMRM